MVTEKKEQGDEGKEHQQLVWIDCVWDELKSWTFPGRIQMSASRWLIMAVRTCNPFQCETNAATVLSSPNHPGPRATSPPAWSQYLNHREGTLGSKDVWTHCNRLQTWWDEQNRQISTKLYGTFYWFCASSLYLTVNSGGRWHNCRSNWWNMNGTAIKETHLLSCTFVCVFFKEACEWCQGMWADFRWQSSFLSDRYSSLLEAALVSELHVTFLHGGKQLI